MVKRNTSIGAKMASLTFAYSALLILVLFSVFAQDFNSDVPGNSTAPGNDKFPSVTGLPVLIPETVQPTPEEIASSEIKMKPSLKKIFDETPNENDDISILIEVDSPDRLTSIENDATSLGAKDTKTIKKARLLATKIPKKQLQKLAAKTGIIAVWSDENVIPFLDDALPQHSIPSAWQSGFTGNGVRIAIIDSGIDPTHPMLSGKVIASQDFTGEGTANDFYGHGTHVAGIAAGTNISGGLYNGIAPEATLLNARVLNSQGVGTTSGVIAGINWALDPDNNPATDDAADIINLSLGAATSDPEHPLNKAVEAAVDAGIIVVAAAGNCGDQASGSCGTFKGVTAPGNSPRAITVGAVDETGLLGP